MAMQLEENVIYKIPRDIYIGDKVRLGKLPISIVHYVFRRFELLSRPEVDNVAFTAFEFIDDDTINAEPVLTRLYPSSSGDAYELRTFQNIDAILRRASL